MRVTRPLVGALAGAVLALSACGSSGGSASNAPATAAPVPKAQIITQGDAICTDRNSKLDGLPAPSNGKDPKAVGTYLRSGAAIAEDATNKLVALGRPDADVPLFMTFLDEQRQQVTAVRGLADQAEGGDITGVTRTLSGPNALADKLKADAAAFGFQACSHG